MLATIALDVRLGCAPKEALLIDTTSDTTYGLTLAPHTEQAFRVLMQAVRPEASYASHKVFIRDAKSAHRYDW